MYYIEIGNKAYNAVVALVSAFVTIYKIIWFIMSDLVSFPVKYLGVEPAKIDDKVTGQSSSFYVFKFIRPAYYAPAAATFNIDQLPAETPNFKKWVKDTDVEQFAILNSLELNKIYTMRWLAVGKYDKETKRTT